MADTELATVDLSLLPDWTSRLDQAAAFMEQYDDDDFRTHAANMRFLIEVLNELRPFPREYVPSEKFNDFIKSCGKDFRAWMNNGIFIAPVMPQAMKTGSTFIALDSIQPGEIDLMSREELKQALFSRGVIEADTRGKTVKELRGLLKTQLEAAEAAPPPSAPKVSKFKKPAAAPAAPVAKKTFSFKKPVAS